MAAIGEGSQTCDAHELDAPRRVNGVVDLLEEFHAGQTPDEVELALPDACLSNGTSSVAEGRSCAAAEQRGGAEGASLVAKAAAVAAASALERKGSPPVRGPILPKTPAMIS